MEHKESAQPIGKKIRRLVVNSAFAVLLVIAVIVMISMSSIRQKNREIITAQTEATLYNAVKDKARFADSEMRKYVAYADIFADYISYLYSNPSKFVPNEVLPPDAKNTGRFVMLRTIRSENITYKSIREECDLLGNVEQIWDSFVKQHPEVNIYLAAKSGVLMTYADNSDLSAPKEGKNEVYYDFTASSWYQQCEKSQRTGFTNVYHDHWGRGQMVTVYSPFFDGSGNFAGALGMDILIGDLHREIVSIDMGDEAYAFLVDHNGRVINLESDSSANTSMLANDKDLNLQTTIDILSGKTGVALSDSGMYCAYAPIKSTGWKLCIKIPRSFVLSPLSDIYDTMNFTLIILLLSFAVIYAAVRLAGAMFSEKLVAPILSLGRDVDAISSGNLNHKAEIMSNDEIGELARHFNRMTASLRKYITNLAEVTAEKERIGAELNEATQIQADMLPKIIPPYLNHEAFDISATMKPAKEVGGDFYDFFMADDNHLALVMADVSGKGSTCGSVHGHS